MDRSLKKLEGSPEESNQNECKYRRGETPRDLQPSRHFNEPRQRRCREPLRSKRLYREFVTAMVVETLRFFCGLTYKDAFPDCTRCHGQLCGEIILGHGRLAWTQSVQWHL